MPEKTTEARGAGGGGDGGVIVPADAGALWHRLAVLCEELARRIEEDRRLYGPNKLGSTLNLNHPAIEEAASIADMLGLPAPILVETEERPPGKDEWPADLDLGACEPSSRRVQITTATVTLAPPLSGETDHGEKFLVGTNYLAGPDSKGGWVLRPSCPANLDDMARRVITALDRWARHARRAADESKPGGAHWQDAQSFAEGVKARALMHVPGAVGAMRALARSARATKRVDAAAGWPERDGAERALGAVVAELTTREVEPRELEHGERASAAFRAMNTMERDAVAHVAGGILHVATNALDLIESLPRGLSTDGGGPVPPDAADKLDRLADALAEQAAPKEPAGGKNGTDAMVRLDQAAALVGKSKRTLKKHRNLPKPDYPGRGRGKAHQ